MSNALTFTLPDANGVLGPVSFHRVSVGEYNNVVPNIKTQCR